MLDIENSRLRKWLVELIGYDILNSATIYATNLIKCSFNKKPSEMGGYNFLSHYFKECKMHLINEILNYKPSLVISFGEHNHQLITTIFDNSKSFYRSMKMDFTGDFYLVSINSYEFMYSPCVHIQTVLRNKKYYELSLTKLSLNIKKMSNS